MKNWNKLIELASDCQWQWCAAMGKNDKAVLRAGRITGSDSGSDA
jgi:hypothetical protein